ncbi:murein hydrolase activator EnvC family protein [Microbacterium sp. YY-01]|uniref:murein hydrolase activator EnvC family protein n=1 Tax=Microbacterium sp. YY-01 TaxID=3421634 RepID=UPI003D163C6A
MRMRTGEERGDRRSTGIRVSMFVVVVIVLAWLMGATPARAEQAMAESVGTESVGIGRKGTEQEWPRATWPVSDAREIVREFIAPAHEYGPGHRGVDIGASFETEVRAPIGGTVAFSGVVVDRPLVTIDTGDGVVFTLEPVLSQHPAGSSVRAGEQVGTLATGGHASAGSLHVGVRWHGVYVNPMLLFGDVPRAVLLPCCSGAG